MLAAVPAHADLNGPLSVIDGDTFIVDGARVRLFGVDALESEQRCGDAQSPTWQCGAWVTAEVRARYEGRDASCAILATDRYGRYVGRCFVQGVDLGQDLVRSGLVFAYPRYSVAYVPDELAARERKAGLHAIGVQSPQHFRDSRKTAKSKARLASAPAGCRIKGNISRTNATKIYHLPGQRWYDETVVSEHRGERWFCTESEARSAGWRKAKR